jgi:hypothetical protein
MRLLTLATGSLVAAVLSAPAPAHANKSKTWEQAWAAGATPKVRIVTDDARVRIHRGDSDSVRAVVHFDVKTWGMTSGTSEPKVVLESDGGVIRIEARSQSNWVVFGGIEVKFEVDVTVPPDCDLSTRSGDGSITCDPLTGRISLESGDGRIRAAGLRGTLVLWSGDGSIEADSLDGSLMARSGDGSMKVNGRFDSLDLRTGDGRMEATARRGSHAASPWSLESGDGSILFRIPRDLQVLLDASSRDGHLRVDLPITTKGAIHNNSLRGELNGGSVLLRMRSGDGSITLALAQ